MPPKTSPLVLVSVRNPEEAEEALAGGADLLDVKEPSRGSLGLADESVLRQIAEAFKQRAPLTAACGELLEIQELPDAQGFWAIKVGLSGCGCCAAWPERLVQLASAQSNADDSPTLLRCPNVRATTKPSWPASAAAGHAPPLLVPVAYADYNEAHSPSLEEVFATVLTLRWPAVMVDTWTKDGRCLFDFVSFGWLREWSGRLRHAGTMLGLAGSLKLEHARWIQDLNPMIVAFRGAACTNQRRQGKVCRFLVRRLVEKIKRPLVSFEECL